MVVDFEGHSVKVRVGEKKSSSAHHPPKGQSIVFRPKGQSISLRRLFGKIFFPSNRGITFATRFWTTIVAYFERQSMVVDFDGHSVKVRVGEKKSSSAHPTDEGAPTRSVCGANDGV